MIKVLLVDDHRLIRSCFTDVLGKDPELAIVAEAGNGEEAIRLVRSHRPDVVLMDVSMPGIGGLEATRRISQSFPDTRIIALTMCGDDPFPSRLLEAGATGYITKGSNIEEVIDAIKSVNGGTEYITQEIAQKLAITYINKKVQSPLDTLTPSFSGHAIQARLYAEDPARRFQPCSGLLTHVAFPDEVRRADE